MNHKISICIIIACIAVAAGICIYGSDRNDSRAEQTERKETQLPSTQTKTLPASGTNFPYLLKEHEGRVVIYTGGNSQEYLETGLTWDMLPEDLQTRLKEGIHFEQEQQLYDFLESYSS